jgi:hypothetical protein
MAINAAHKGAGTAQADAALRQEITNLRSDVTYLLQQVHGFR